MGLLWVSAASGSPLPWSLAHADWWLGPLRGSHRLHLPFRMHLMDGTRRNACRPPRDCAPGAHDGMLQVQLSAKAPGGRRWPGQACGAVALSWPLRHSTPTSGPIPISKHSPVDGQDRGSSLEAGSVLGLESTPGTPLEGNRYASTEQPNNADCLTARDRPRALHPSRQTAYIEIHLHATAKWRGKTERILDYEEKHSSLAETILSDSRAP